MYLLDTNVISELRKVSAGNTCYAYTMGVIVRGSNAPLAWREGAKRLLFVTERPYLK